MALPSNVQTGTVIGRFLSIKGGTPIAGTVTFTPSFTKALDSTATPSPVTLLPEAETATLDSNGAFTATLVATDDADLGLGAWTWMVAFSFGPTFTVPSFPIAVPQGTTVDLTTVAPAGQANGALLVQGIPAGGSTGQILAKNSATNYDTEWINAPTGPGGGGTWGSITGTLSAQTDLQTALNGKAATSHTHTAANVTDFAEAVDDRVAALLVAGANVTLSYNDATGQLTISAAGGGGGGAVDSVNSQTGAVVLDAADVGARPDTYVPTWSEVTSKPAVIAAGADMATARSAIGAGTSTVAIGTTSTTAMAGNKTAADLGGVVGTGITDIVKITQAAYDALGTPDPDTLYVVV